MDHLQFLKKGAKLSVTLKIIKTPLSLKIPLSYLIF